MEQHQAMAAVLKNCVGGIQESFGVVFERLANNVKQTSHMMETMNSMMEAMLVRNVKLATRVSFSPTQKRPLLYITIKNQTSVPLKDVQCTVEIENDVEIAMNETFDLNVDQEMHFEAPFVSKVRKPTSGITRIAFPSPGTNQTLETHVKFEILQLHHLDFKFCSTLETNVLQLLQQQQPNSIVLSTRKVRELLEVSDFNPLVLKSQGYYTGYLDEKPVLTVALERSENPLNVLLSWDGDEYTQELSSLT